jgi:hypothetical protein
MRCKELTETPHPGCSGLAGAAAGRTAPARAAHACTYAISKRLVRTRCSTLHTPQCRPSPSPSPPPSLSAPRVRKRLQRLCCPPLSWPLTLPVLPVVSSRSRLQGCPGICGCAQPLRGAQALPLTRLSVRAARSVSCRAALPKGFAAGLTATATALVSSPAWALVRPGTNLSSLATRNWRGTACGRSAGDRGRAGRTAGPHCAGGRKNGGTGERQADRSCKPPYSRHLTPGG